MQPVARRRLVRMVTTLAGWAVAYLVVMALLTVLGRPLAALPVALRAAVISGTMIAVMVNLVMPALSRIIPRWLAGPSPTSPAKPASEQIRTDE
jgi:antibiotic biosynthesis monooxygenase (ABM) superfamily enzyme